MKYPYKTKYNLKNYIEKTKFLLILIFQAETEIETITVAQWEKWVFNINKKV